MNSIVILTGAGISAESGLQTFRGDDGLWEGHRIEDVCTPEAFARDPALVQQFYDARRARAAEVDPNPAHFALARLESEWDGEVMLVTQNVDSLHERAGSRNLIHMHGELNRGWCLDCDKRFDWEGPMSPLRAHLEPVEGRAPSPIPDKPFNKLRVSAKGERNLCPACGAAGTVRPDIVWFGEMPYRMERIEEALRSADLFVSIGTSGAVYPAAGFVQTAKYCGARTLEINLDPSQGSMSFDERRYGQASVEVPKWVGELLT